MFSSEFRGDAFSRGRVVGRRRRLLNRCRLLDAIRFFPSHLGCLGIVVAIAAHSRRRWRLTWVVGPIAILDDVFFAFDIFAVAAVGSVTAGRSVATV